MKINVLCSANKIATLDTRQSVGYLEVTQGAEERS